MTLKKKPAKRIGKPEKKKVEVEWSNARKHAFIVSVLRSGTRRFPPKFQTLNEAKTEKRINPKTGRLAQHYKCAGCSQEFPAKEVQVNHIEPVVPVTGFVSWDDYIERMYCGKDGLEVLCIPCHKKITLEENRLRKEFTTDQERQTYQCWLDMKSRCYNSNHPKYPRYGQRNIFVDIGWRYSFDSFLKDMGLKPDSMTINRKDNDGHYTAANCEWSTPKEQAYNRETNVRYTHDGVTLTVQEWADKVGITHSAMKKRFLKWPIERAVVPKGERDTNRSKRKE